MKKKLKKIGNYHGYELFIDLNSYRDKDSSFPPDFTAQMAESFISHAHKTNEVLAGLKEVMEIR